MGNRWIIRVSFLLHLTFTIYASASACEKGWVSFHRRCFYFSTSTAILKDALMACHNLGADLLELQNSLEEKWIDIQSRLRDYHFGVWLGVSDIQHEGDFVSISNARRIYYNNWMKNEPNNYGGNEHCTMYWVSRRGWNDTPCTSKMNYVCKKLK